MIHVAIDTEHIPPLGPDDSRLLGRTPHIIIYVYVYIYKRKKHFIKMFKDVGMVVPKIRETRL